MKTVIIALLMSLGFISSITQNAQAQSVNYFYCFALDPDSRNIYMSQTLPVGPVGERKNYGQEFAQFLLESRRVVTKVTGHCIMRPTAAEVDQSRFALMRDGCGVCGGAEGYQNVTWPRDKLTPPEREMQAAITAVSPPKPSAVKPPAAPEPTEPQYAVIVMGNADSGEFELGFGETKKDVEARAKARTASGWSTLLTSTSAGYGAAFCVPHKGKTQFFAAAGDYREEALREAVRPALVFARKVGAKASLCNKWRTRYPGAETAPEPDLYWIDLLKGLIYRMATECKAPATCDFESLVTFGVRG